MTVAKDILYIGVNDHTLDLFEGQYPVPKGMAYNSYVILDERVAVLDTVDQHFQDQWLTNLETALAGRKPDYLIVQHMEPDHSAAVAAFLSRYPEATIAASAKAFPMLEHYYGDICGENRLVLGDRDTLDLGTHQLCFLTAPMVHWPEVLVTYDAYAKTLFSADAFGKFGALDQEEPWTEEARRYYFGIVGKYGAQVLTLFKKLSGMEIETICPLHGPVLREEIPSVLKLYQTWASYRAETPGVLIACASVYGHTMEAAEQLAQALREQGGLRVTLLDLTRCDMSQAVAEAFRYDRLVLASVTYNADVFPCMKAFLHHLAERNYQGRRVGLMENGSWAPMAAKCMVQLLSGCKNLTFTETTVRIQSALGDDSMEQLMTLARELGQAETNPA